MEFKELFFDEQGEWTCIIDIPTRLAPRETSILCCQTQETFIKKGGKIITKGGGTRPWPSKKTEKKKHKRKQQNNIDHRKKSRDSVIRKSTSIPKEIKPQISRKAIQPNRSNRWMPQRSQFIRTIVSFSENMRRNNMNSQPTSIVPSVS